MATERQDPRPWVVKRYLAVREQLLVPDSDGWRPWRRVRTGQREGCQDREWERQGPQYGRHTHIDTTTVFEVVLLGRSASWRRGSGSRAARTPGVGEGNPGSAAVREVRNPGDLDRRRPAGPGGGGDPAGQAGQGLPRPW